jgi:hypothetical protein
MMLNTFKVEEPGKIKFTLTMTMTLDEWKELAGQLQRQWPSSQLSDEISSMSSQANCTFYPKGES